MATYSNEPFIYEQGTVTVGNSYTVPTGNYFAEVWIKDTTSPASNPMAWRVVKINSGQTISSIAAVYPFSASTKIAGITIYDSAAYSIDYITYEYP